MAGASDITNVTWAVTSACEVALIAVMVRRRFYSSHFAFFLYLILALGQSILGYELYRVWGMQNPMTAWVIWSSQVVLVYARGAAVFELARQILQNYRGIWRLSRRVMIAVAALVLVYSLVFSVRQYNIVIMSVDRGMELAIGAIVAMLLLLARYYGVVVSASNRMLCAGFCLYSCAYVINFTLFERKLVEYAQFWNFVNILIFVATVCLWIAAVYGGKETELSKTGAPAPTAPETLSPESKNRLRLLHARFKQALGRPERS
jgi:hypothetical protein